MHLIHHQQWSSKFYTSPTRGVCVFETKVRASTLCLKLSNHAVMAANDPIMQPIYLTI